MTLYPQKGIIQHNVLWETPALKPLYWIGSSSRDLTEFPAAVRREAGYLRFYLAQIGMKAINVKPLKGFGGAGVLEVVSSYDGSAYRAVYTLKFAGAVFVLHAFGEIQKRNRHTARRYRDNQAATQNCRR